MRSPAPPQAWLPGSSGNPSILHTVKSGLHDEPDNGELAIASRERMGRIAPGLAVYSNRTSKSLASI